MAKTIAGAGPKKPQIYIPIGLLNLDSQNPRLANDGRQNTQLDLLGTLYSDFDIDELAYSMCANGYFDEEPVVVVPSKKPKNFSLPTKIEDQQIYLQELIKEDKIHFIVVEGNRRTATLKILNDPSLRQKVGVAEDFPKASGKALDDLKVIPAIFYLERNDVTAYLGVRHISGSKKWDFYPRVFYVSQRIEEKLNALGNYQVAFEEVQRQVALRRSDAVIKHYLYYRIAKIIESDLDFDIDPVIKNFSLIEVAVRSPGIRQFIGLGDNSNFLKEIDFTKRVIPSKFSDSLERILTWIYGNKKKNILPLFTDSRNIPSLGKILINEDAREYLVGTNDFEGAYERSDGELEMLEKKINEAKKKLESSMQIAYKHKSRELIELVDLCINAAEALKKALSK
ncbi:hypothetical protein BH11BAC5_BH11BAC5_33070 [soil metagenome]